MWGSVRIYTADTSRCTCFKNSDISVKSLQSSVAQLDPKCFLLTWVLVHADRTTLCTLNNEVC